MITTKCFWSIFDSFSCRISSREGCGGSSPRRTQNTIWSTAISGNSAGSTPRQDQSRSEMQPQPLVRFPMGLASRTCLTSLPWGILDTYLNQR